MIESLETRPYLVFGIDIGIGSAGWSLLDIANKRIVDMGVHLWEVPQEPKTKVSTATTRRNARSSRRNNDRHATRMAKCLELLKAHGLVPEDAEASYLQPRKGEKQILAIRSEGLDRKLSDREFARALYHICNRRGYIPHGDGDANDTEGKQVLSAIDANSKTMHEKGYRTVGEMMLKEGILAGKPNGFARNTSESYEHCIMLSQLVDEVGKLFDAQRANENPSATDKLEEQYITCLTWQKPTYDRDELIYKTVGPCVYYPEEKRAARATLSFERCVAHERLCNIRIVLSDGTEQSLMPQMRKRIMEGLFLSLKPKKCTYTQLKKSLSLPERAYFKNVADDAMKKPVYEPKAWQKLCEKLDEVLLTRLMHDVELADEICEALTFASTEQSLRERLATLSEAGRISEKEIGEICTVPFTSNIFNGYGTRSLRALHMLNDAFADYEAIEGLSEAEAACGLFGKRLDDAYERGYKLPPYAMFDPTCKNPVVLRVMASVRKLVNALIADHGVPDEIHIELARELKHSVREKKLITKRNNARKKQNDANRLRLAEDLGCGPDQVPGKLVRKLALFNEQNEQDIYTGESISYERLLRDANYCQIDHILPYSRTCDDSQTNKVLVLAKSNQEKAERSPYEWLNETGKWDSFKERILELRTGSYPNRKADKLLEEHLDEKQQGFIERNLNDTRYASKKAKEYLESYLEFPKSTSPSGIERKKRVCAVAGGATSNLRRFWGFNAKDREKDDTHHAVDASIIAACREETVKAVARYSEQKHYKTEEDRKALLQGSEPWPGFAEEVQTKAEQVIPTRKVERSMTGAAFEDTAYHFKGLTEKGGKGILLAKGKEKRSGNYRTLPDGNTRILGDMACLRLWWDPSVKVRGRKTLGMYLAEPIYAADLPYIKNGSYVPRICPGQTEQAPRAMWPELDISLKVQKPIVLFPGQLIKVNGVLCRYKQFKIAGNKWVLFDPRKFSSGEEPLKGVPISSVAKPEGLQLINEDILGKCFKEAETSEE